MAFSPRGWEPDPAEYMRAIHSRNTAELRCLALSSNRFVRARVAANEHAPPDLLMYLVDDEDPAVCAAAVGNRSATRHIVMCAELSKRWQEQSHWPLQAVLMSSWFTSGTVIDELYRMDDWNLKLGRVNRKDCPRWILEEYAALPYNPKPAEGDGGVEAVLQIMRRKARVRLRLPIVDEDDEY